MFFAAIHYLGLIATLTAIACVIRDPGPTATRFLLGSMAFSAVSWFIAYFKRRSAHCPLCMGTPLVTSGARPHIKARRIGPLNEGVTATLSVLAVQKFRCMYCGSDFDLLKTPSRLLGGKPADPNAGHDRRN